MSIKMASEIFDISSMPSFESVYPISSTDLSKISYDNDDLTDLNNVNLLNSIYDECIITSANDEDDVQNFLKDFLQAEPINNSAEKRLIALNENLWKNIENRIVTTNSTESNELTQISNTSQTPSTPKLVDFRNVFVAEPSIYLNNDTTPLTSRQLRYRSLPPQVCELCEKTFSARQHLQRHRLEKHAELAANKHKFVIYPCKQCHKSYKRREHLRVHERTKHSSAVKNYKCEKCGKRFVRKDHLKRHATNHEIIKNESTCGSCGKAFAKRANLMKHEANGCMVRRELTCRSIEISI